MKNPDTIRLTAAGGKPSTWFPPGRLVEQDLLKSIKMLKLYLVINICFKHLRSLQKNEKIYILLKYL